MAITGQSTFNLFIFLYRLIILNLVSDCSCKYQWDGLPHPLCLVFCIAYYKIIASFKKNLLEYVDGKISGYQVGNSCRQKDNMIAKQRILV